MERKDRHRKVFINKNTERRQGHHKVSTGLESGRKTKECVEGETKDTGTIQPLSIGREMK